MKNFTIFDNSKYQPGLCSNGGYYAFWQTYDWVAGEEGKPGHYDKQFYTTRTRGLCRISGHNDQAFLPRFGRPNDRSSNFHNTRRLNNGRVRTRNHRGL